MAEASMTKCPKCQFDNREGIKFCEECGTKIELKCPECGAEIPFGRKFCGECGHNLEKLKETPSIDYTQPQSYTPDFLADKILTSRSSLEGERKQVTVLLADIKDSTELIKDLDPEAAQQLLDPAIHIMMDAVHRYEGTVNQVLGDGIMALFGAPIAHEDHALRACYAALAMQTAMGEHTNQVRQAHGIELRIRVGLNSGEVVVRTIGNDLHMDYSAVGSTTHLAARMEQISMPGTTRLTKATFSLIEGFVKVKALGPMPVKGMTEPVEVFELVRASTIRRRLQAAVAYGLTRFVGRETEIKVLGQVMELAGAGQGQVVAAVGEAGVGKSRLVYEFIQSHRTKDWRVLESASVSYGKATPYFPVVDLLKRYVHAEDGDEPRTIRAKVTGQVLTLDETLQETIPALLSLLDTLPDDSPFLALDPSQRRRQTLNALKRILLRESQLQPLLVVFEDLHWIDTETQALLDDLIESLPTARLMLLVNYRPEYQHSWGSKTYYTQLRLDPFPPESAEVFLKALLGNDTGLVPLKKLLIERTGGNPFFLEECVRTLVETKVLAGQPGAYRQNQELPAIQVPATVQALLSARIDRLSSSQKRLLQTAAVIGNEVSLPLLQAIAGLPEEDLLRGLSHLQSAEFLYETSLYPERIHTFKHALTQNVAYQSLLVSTRKQVHQQIARVLEKQFAETVMTQPELLAHHYSEAGCHKEAAGHWQRAGERASARSAYVEAIAHFRKGLELLQALPETAERDELELALQFGLATSLVVPQGWTAPEVEQAYARAYELCRQVGETPTLILVLQGLRLLYSGRGERGDAQRSLELGEQLLALAQRQNDNRSLQEAHWALGQTLYYLGELNDARTHLEQSNAFYTPKTLSSQADRDAAGTQIACLFYTGWVLWVLGYPDRAIETGDQALSLAHELAHPFTLGFAFWAMAQLNQFRREVHATLKRAEAMIALSNEQGFPVWVMAGTKLRGWTLAMQGHPEEGIAQMRQVIANKSVGLDKSEWPMVYALLVEAYGAAGQVEEGLGIVAKALALVEKTGFRFYEAELLRLQGELLLKQAAPDVSHAETCFHRALDLARRQQAKSLELRTAISLCRLWQQQGKREEAYKLLAEIYGWFTEGFDTTDLKEARALLEELSG
jgi:class 3 adenylate cyclase/predicted ATPase